MIQRPMLAATAEKETDIRLPALVTPKLDGIRCVIVNGRALARSFKPIRNDHARKLLETLPNGLDGELIVGDGFNSTTSGIMSCSGQPDFRYWVFDYYHPTMGYEKRITLLQILELPPFVCLVVPQLATTVEELLAMEEHYLKHGYEGLMARSPQSPYKFGRSSLRENYLVKLKRTADSEMRITGFEEMLENTNEVCSDEFGYAKRPGGRANHVPKGTLGTLLGEDVSQFPGLAVRIGSGMDYALRDAVWADQAAYVGRIVKYKYQKVGIVEKPRFPRFVGFRDERDM